MTPRRALPGSLRATLATNMRGFRKARDLSQEGLGNLAGLDRSYVGALERGERNLSVDILERIADALGINAVELAREAPSDPAPQRASSKDSAAKSSAS